MKYLKPEMEVIKFEVINTITTSVTEETNGTTENEGSVTTPPGSWG